MNTYYVVLPGNTLNPYTQSTTIEASEMSISPSGVLIFSRHITMLPEVIAVYRDWISAIKVDPDAESNDEN